MASYPKRQVELEEPGLTPQEEFKPRTPLGRELWELRKRIVASGEPLLDAEGIEREVAERRGAGLTHCATGV